MSGNISFQRRLKKVKEYVLEIGDVVEESGVDDLIEVEWGNEDYILSGHRCSSGNEIYLVAGHPEIQPLLVFYFLSLTQNVGDQVDEETAKAILEEAPEDEIEMSRQAGETLLDKVPRDKMESLKNYTYMYISGSSHSSYLYTNENDSLIGFHTDRLVFPSDGEIQIDDFYDAVVRVIESGSRGSKVLNSSVFVSKDESSPENSQIRLNFGW